MKDDTSTATPPPPENPTAPPMDEFESAAEAFEDAFGQARKRLAQGKTKQAQKGIGDAERQVRRMESEARHSDGVERRRLVGRIKQFKTRLQGLKQEHQQTVAGGGSPSRNGELFGNGGGRGKGGHSFNAMSAANQQRARILENNATQKETDDLLAASQRIAEETREIGTAALNGIEDQTDMLIEAKDSVDRAHRETTRAGKLLNTMSRRVCTNKLFLVFIVLLLLGANILVIWLNRRDTHSHPSPSPPPKPVAPAPSAVATTETMTTLMAKTQAAGAAGLTMAGGSAVAAGSAGGAAGAGDRHGHAQMVKLEGHVVAQPAYSTTTPTATKTVAPKQDGKHVPSAITQAAFATAAADKGRHGEKRNKDFDKAVEKHALGEIRKGGLRGTAAKAPRASDLVQRTMRFESQLRKVA